MPTFNKYKNKLGYFIRAWTPETGNINYKIRKEGNPIVEDFGLKDGDEISWDTINSLKALGLIYTDESGTIATDEFVPDPDHISETSLSDQKAHDLFDILHNHRNISPNELDEICGILGIDKSTNELTNLGNLLNEKVREIIDDGALPTKHTLGEISSEDNLLNVTVDNIQDETKNGYAGINIILISQDTTGTNSEMTIHLGDDTESDGGRMIIHWVFVCQSHGIERWEVAFNGNRTWEQKGEVIRQKGQLIPIIANSLKEIDIDPESPLETPSPPFVEFNEIGV